MTLFRSILEVLAQILTVAVYESSKVTLTRPKIKKKCNIVTILWRSRTPALKYGLKALKMPSIQEIPLLMSKRKQTLFTCKAAESQQLVKRHLQCRAVQLQALSGNAWSIGIPSGLAAIYYD